MNLRAWLELSRCSNLPTVWSNVLHGMAAGLFVMLERGGPTDLGAMPTEPTWFFNQGFMLLVGMSLIYAGGMVLNDAFDAEQDAQTRRGRPIPSGRVSRRSALAVGFAALLLGVACSLVFRSPVVPALAGALALTVVAYNALHRVKWLAWTLMPLCRALVFLSAAAAFGSRGGEGWFLHPHIWIGALALAGFTAMITLAAWAEDSGNAARKQRVVAAMIAAIALIDAAGCLALGQHALAGVCVGLAMLTVLLQRTVPGT